MLDIKKYRKPISNHPLSNCRQRSHPTVAVPPRAADRQVLPGVHLVDRGRLGVQAHRPGRGCQTLGHPQEQAQDELREAQPRPALLLRQEHHTQDGGQEVRLPVRLRPPEPARVHSRGTARHGGFEAREEGR